MICTSCGTENERGRKFCVECGTKLASGCPNCGAANPPGAKFCGECGTTLTADAGAATAGGTAAGATPAQRSAAPIAERRVVSVLFADLVGFTAASEGRDAEETREVLNRYFELARDVIGRYGGTVEKFIGDAVMAVWGAPTAHEDDAERAVRAGLELVDAIHGLGPGMEARAGVLTGEAAVTMNATNQGMVAGDLVNTASRLQSVALPGTVLVGEATHRAASKAIAFEEAGEQSLKGKTSPVPAWRALRVVAEVGGRNRSEALEAPFVGRDEELRLLKDLFHATSRDQRVRLVSVIGPAGIGKSRLAWEFLKYVDGLTETVWWHDGRSPAYGDGITFWALGEMIRERCHLLATDDDATTRLRVREAVEEWIPDEVEQRWVEPALLALLGTDIGVSGGTASTGPASAAGRDELFAAWRTFFERIAARGTVVMVFEDLHWADPGLLDFIDHLLEWSRGLPIYVVTLARPDLLERRSDWGAGKRNFTSLSLEPLTTTAMRQLLAGLVPGLPEHVAQHITERADGIPLYAVETIRMLLAEGRLREEDGAYRPVGPLTSLAVPETLQALISARLDGLEPADRSVLQDAAVLGQSFTAAGVGAVSGLDPEALEPRLRTLVRRELLIVQTDPRSPERGQYAFVQALIREVAYNTLARAERKSRHLAAARWFEALDEGELAGALAAQYVAAYRNSPEGPEADALVGQARIALKGAAERAVSLGSNRQALGFLRQALEITTDETEATALRERAAEAAADDSQFDTSRELLDEAIAWHRANADLPAVARTTAALGAVLINISQPVAAVKVLEGVAAETTDIDDEPGVVRLLTELSRAYALAGDPRALATADRALELGERLELVPSIAEALLNRALALSHGGRRFYETVALLRGALALAEANGLGYSRLRATNNLAATLENDDPREAIALSENGIDYARRIGNRAWLEFMITGMSSILVYVGEWGKADRAIAELEGRDLAIPAQLTLGQVRAMLHAFRGEIDAADALLDDIEPLYTNSDDPRVEGWRLSTRSIVHWMAGRLEEAYADGIACAQLGEDGAEVGAEVAGDAALALHDPARAQEALDLHRARHQHGRVPKTAEIQLEAGIRALEGDRVAASAGYRSAIAFFRDRDMRLPLALALSDYAVLARPDQREADAAATEARAIFTALGSPPLLARLETGLAEAAAAGAPRRVADGAVGTESVEHAVESTAG
ncbi:MAG: AAA family ATPase [Candidatus Limnocylindrales bacterium]